jgi:hypothetical protein
MPNPLLLVQNSCLGWFRAISLSHVTHYENGCRGAYKHEFLPPEPFLRFSQRTCPNHYFRSKTHVCVVLRNFVAARHPFRKRVSGCIQSISFCHRNHFSFFATNMPKPLILGPKLMFGWFREISLPHVTRFENGCRGAYKARVFATGTISSFFATNMPNPLL